MCGCLYETCAMLEQPNDKNDDDNVDYDDNYDEDDGAVGDDESSVCSVLSGPNKNTNARTRMRDDDRRDDTLGYSGICQSAARACFALPRDVRFSQSTSLH